jgi:tetratricopeptide (TPR) repeat protein
MLFPQAAAKRSSRISANRRNVSRDIFRGIAVAAMILATAVLLLAATTRSAFAVNAKPASELLASGSADEAIRVLRVQVQKAPHDGEAWLVLLQAYYRMQHWDEAIAAGQKAVVLDPLNSRFHLWLGRAYGEKAAHSSWFSALVLARKTRTEFEMAVALNGQNNEARADLAEFYLEAPAFLGGGKDKALALADQAHALGAEGTFFRIRAAVAETEKNYALAEQNFQAAILATHDPDFILDLATFYLRRGRLADMDKTANEAVKTAMNTQSSPVLVGAAELLYSAGQDFRAASQLLRNYIGSSYHSADAPLFRAHYLLGSVLEKQGEKDAATEQYRAALALASDFGPARQALRNLQ